MIKAGSEALNFDVLGTSLSLFLMMNIDFFS